MIILAEPRQIPELRALNRITVLRRPDVRGARNVARVQEHRGVLSRGRDSGAVEKKASLGGVDKLERNDGCRNRRRRRAQCGICAYDVEGYVLAQ